MKFSKALFLVATTLGAAVLTGCQSQSNVINFSIPSPTASFNTQNQAVSVKVNTQDLRSSREIVNYTKSGQAIHLTSSPEVTQLFQQVMQQDLNAKGFHIVPNGANANVTLGVKRFFATVEQGNLRHKANAEVSIDVNVQGSKGNFNKSFNATRSYEGVFGADNDSVEDVLKQAYQDVVSAIYNDNEVANAIHQYK